MLDERTRLINGLFDLAAFLEANPDIPVNGGTFTINQFPESRTDADKCAEVDHVAELLGTEIDPAHWRNGHYTTSKQFGPVTYAFTAITAAAWARHRANDSYRGCIQPDSQKGKTRDR